MGLPDELVDIHHLWWPVKVRDCGGPKDQVAKLAYALEREYWERKRLEAWIKELELELEISGIGIESGNGCLRKTET